MSNCIDECVSSGTKTVVVPPSSSTTTTTTTAEKEVKANV